MSEIITKSKKVNTNEKKNNSNKFGLNTINDKKSFDNVISDINLDIMKIYKKLEKHSNYQENLQSLLEQEIKLRQDIEKKTYLINENLTTEISKIKFNMNNFTQTINDSLKEYFQKMTEAQNKQKENLEIKSAEINKKMEQYDLTIKKNQEEKNNKLIEFEEKMKLIEENNLNNYQTLQKNNKKDISLIKNEIQSLKNAKINTNSEMNKLIKEIDSININFDKTIIDINNHRMEIQTKINNFESGHRIFHQDFETLKENLFNHINDINDINKSDLIKTREEIFDNIKQIKNDMNQFNLNIIKENQKFILIIVRLNYKNMTIISKNYSNIPVMILKSSKKKVTLWKIC